MVRGVMALQPFFLKAEKGQRFCIYHPAEASGARGAVIYLHPFAEELNKSRRMAACQAREMAKLGFDVLQIDLLGCGDSSGDYADATWNAWQDDVLLAYRWLRARSEAPLTLWGLRSGCLLAASAAVNLPEKANFVFWQPVVSGKQYWQQFMRLKLVSEITSGQSKSASEEIRKQLIAGTPVEIAGYTVAPALVNDFEQSQLNPAQYCNGRVAWLELSMREGATLSPVFVRLAEQWQQSGYEVDLRLVRGPAFWQTSEIEEAPELISSTIALMESWG
uniref:Esterase/lipase/thioesterase family active site n=1 Tax=Dechloromonas aromatica (strain RCB) TaxID=159087 RepID=Q47DB5_DECAR